jgi:protein gp37
MYEGVGGLQKLLRRSLVEASWTKVWGVKADRRFFGDKHWAEPLKWNTEAQAAGRRLRVFCASMADVFEDRSELNVWREKLWTLIEATPQLDWLLLTKRPELVTRLVRWGADWPHKVWLGTTVEDQESAEFRLTSLREVPAMIRFISAEPLLGPLTVRPWLGSTINWVITGGESGPKARPSSPSWFRELLTQCIAERVPFHFKQWGDWVPGHSFNQPAIRVETTREADDGTVMVRVGKKAAGRLLSSTRHSGLRVSSQEHRRASRAKISNLCGIRCGRRTRLV